MRLGTEPQYRGMHFTTDTPWLTSFVLASAAERSGAATQFYRAARAGKFVRLAHGVHLPIAVWEELGVDDRFAARVHAAAKASRPGLVFSHLSAAALWRLPLVGQWPTRAEVVTPAATGGRSRRAFIARSGPLPHERVYIDGLRVTPLARTLIDVGHTTELATSVAMLDFALRAAARGEAGLPAQRVSGRELVRELESRERDAGRLRCVRALDLADGNSGSPGESLSRVGMHVLGLPAPLLQHPFRDARGLVGYVDFWWPEFNLAGEFDGIGKYLRDELLAGRGPADAVVSEKLREDRLRALGLRVTRWGWPTARSLPQLERHLRAAGLK